MPPNESPVDRGIRCEPLAIERFMKETEMEVEQVGLITSTGSDGIGNSPDGIIRNKKGKITESVEVKCLSSANHLKAFMTGHIPEDYYEQGLQYFVVNHDLQTLHFVFFDDRLEVADYFVIKMTRKEVEEEIEKLRAEQMEFLKEIEKFTQKLIEF